MGTGRALLFEGAEEERFLQIRRLDSPRMGKASLAGAVCFSPLAAASSSLSPAPHGGHFGGWPCPGCFPLGAFLSQVFAAASRSLPLLCILDLTEGSFHNKTNRN